MSTLMIGWTAALSLALAALAWATPPGEAPARAPHVSAAMPGTCARALA